MASAEPPRALPLIFTAPGENTFQIGEEAVEFLQSIDRPVAVVIVAGRYRSGKSFLLNRLLGVHGFGVGHTVESHTKGIWVSSHILKGKAEDGDDIDVLVMDSEGLGATEKSEQYDSTVFALATLLSSTLVFNGGSTIDETSLENLGFVVNLSKHIRIRSASDGDGGEEEADFLDQIQAFTPSFVYVLRDFSLELVDDDGDRMTPDEYLEAALEERDGFDVSVRQRNRIRRSIRSFFRHRRCVPLPRPVEEESSLQQLDTIPDTDLRGVFRAELDRLRGLLLLQAKPKRLGSQLVTGPFLATMTRAYVTGINEGGVPSIGDAWQSAAADQCRRLADEMAACAQRWLTPPPYGRKESSSPHSPSYLPTKLPVDAASLETAVQQARQAAASQYRAQLPPQAGKAGDEQQAELDRRVDRIAEELRQQNSQESDRSCRSEAQRLLAERIEPVAQRAGALARNAVRDADVLQQQQQKDTDAGRDAGEGEASMPIATVEDARSAVVGCLTELLEAWNSMEQEYESQARGPSKGTVRLQVSIPALVRAGGSVMRSQQEVSDALGRLVHDARTRLELRASRLQERVDSLEREVSATLAQLQTQTRAVAKEEARADALEHRLETTREHLRETKDALGEARDALEAAESEVKRLQEREHTLERELQTAQEGARRTEEALRAAKDDHSAAKRRVEELEREVQRWQRKCEQSSKEADSLRQDHERLKEEGTSSALERRKLEDTCSTYESRIRHLEEKVEVTQSALEREQAAAERHRELHEEEKQSLNRQLEVVAADRSQAREELREAQQAREESRKEAAEQKEAHEKAMQRLQDQMEERHQAWQSYADSLQSQVTQGQAEKRSTMESLKEQHAAELSSLREQHATEIASLRTLCETLRAEASEEADRASARKSECDRLREELRAEREELGATRAEAAEEQARVTATWKTERSVWEKRVGDAEKKATSVQEEYEEARAEWDEQWNAKEKEIQDERKSMQDELHQQKVELDSLATQKQSLEETVQTLQEAKHALDAALRRTRDEAHSAHAQQDSLLSQLHAAQRAAEEAERRSQEALAQKDKRVEDLQSDLETHQSRLQMAEESLVTAAETLQDSHRELRRLEEQCERLGVEAHEAEERRIAAEHRASDAEARARRVLVQREESEAIWHATETKLRDEVRDLRASQGAAEAVELQLRTEREDARSAQRAAERQSQWLRTSLSRARAWEAALREGASQALQDAARAVVAREQRIQDLARAKANLRRRLRRHRAVESAMGMLRSGSAMTRVLDSGRSSVPARVTAEDGALAVASDSKPTKRREGQSPVIRIPWETVRSVSFGRACGEADSRGAWARQILVQANQAPYEILVECSSPEESLRWVFGLRCRVLDAAGMDRFSLSPVAVKLERAGLRLAAQAAQARQSISKCLAQYRIRARREFAPMRLARAFQVVLIRAQRRRLEALASGRRSGLEHIVEPESDGEEEDEANTRPQPITATAAREEEEE